MRPPPRYRALARPLGVVGAIAVEASPWIEDNLWLLETAQTDTMIVGVIGNLEPDKPEFAEYLDRYHKNPLFLGIRYGNLWGRDLTKQAENGDFRRRRETPRRCRTRVRNSQSADPAS